MQFPNICSVLQLLRQNLFSTSLFIICKVLLTLTYFQIEEEFVVRKYASVLVARGNLKRTFHRVVSPLSEFEPDFVRVAKEMAIQNSMHDVILVDKVLILVVSYAIRYSFCH